MRASFASFVVALAALTGAACGDSGRASIASRASALSQALAPVADTFVNSARADNNNGASPSLFVGQNGQGGAMRGLVRFALPPALVGDAWSEGTGFGDGSTANTVGELCTGTGATWNRPDCGGAATWTGGGATGGVSATATVPDAIEATVTWDSDAFGNAGL